MLDRDIMRYLVVKEVETNPFRVDDKGCDPEIFLRNAYKADAKGWYG